MPEIHEVLVLSTAHVTYNTSLEMTRLSGNTEPGGPIIYEKGGYGWWVHIPEDVEEIDDMDLLPADLRAVMIHAADLDCQWVMFDLDADIVDDLPTWEW